MHNCSCVPAFLQLIALGTPSAPVYDLSRHGRRSTTEEKVVMFLLDAFAFLSFLLLVLHLVSFLLTKLFAFLLETAAATSSELQRIRYASPSPSHVLLPQKDEIELVSGESYSGDGDLVAGFVSGQEGLLFFYNERVLNDTLLVDEEKDSNEQQQNQRLEVDESLVAESSYGSPLENDEKLVGDRYDDVPVTADAVERSDLSPPILSGLEKDDSICGNASRCNEEEEGEEVVVVEGFSENYERLLVVDQARTDRSKKFELEEDKETCGGSLTGESTSKSSTEWKSSTFLRDSETECPFSSSSRRSSSRWEAYTLFRRYDEERTFFDRVSAQKLTETESFRSINFQPRSISQRIAHKFTPQKKKGAGKDPYQELESAYVAQICLAWEALNWNYNNFQQMNDNAEGCELSFCAARIAQQFQQFQVLLQRFIENEPYECGRRPEVFARTRISSPKLLQVPEFRDSVADEGKEDMVSSAEFMAILEDAIRTFMAFLKADKENPCRVLKAIIKRRTSLEDPNLLLLLRRANKKKKMRLKDLLKRRRCVKNKRLNGDQEDMEILMGLIDLKIASRILRMPEISQEQLHWCEEKMTKVRVWDGKVQRDPSSLFFPVH